MAFTDGARAKADRPETVRQAARWENNKRKNLGLDLCPTCASQVAWGHQIGFSKTEPLCRPCWVRLEGSPAQVATSPRADAVAPRRRLAGHAKGKGPRRWELCYLSGGIRESQFVNDRAAFDGLKVEA